MYITLLACLIVSYNPIIADDNVFMESDDERQEYIASSYGKIWTGLVDEPIAWPWAYEQVWQDL